MQSVFAINEQVVRQSFCATQISLSGDTPDVLTQIFDTQIKLCIFKRAMNTDVQEYSAFLQQAFQDFRITQVMSLCQSGDLLNELLPQHHCRQNFIEDILTVANMFADLFDLEQVGFRLCVLNKAMCPRFHTDKVPCRLITTYSGKGTEWLDSRTVKPEMPGISHDEPVYTELVRRLEAGDVALFKGDAWDENEGFGVVHRSPLIVVHRSPLISADETRLLLTLDFSC